MQLVGMGDFTQVHIKSSLTRLFRIIVIFFHCRLDQSARKPMRLLTKMFLLSKRLPMLPKFDGSKSPKKSARKPSKVAAAASLWSQFCQAIPFAIPLAIPLALGVGIAPAEAVREPDYFACAEDMTAAGLSAEEAIGLCSSARYPQDVGACVIDVSEFTGLTAASAAFVCGRSRRPIEVANCTIDIHDAFFAEPSTTVLNNCGRSLLPARYGSCVVDIVDATETDVDEALTQCTRAGYRPWQIRPRS